MQSATSENSSRVLKPFHDSIVDLIKTASTNDLSVIGTLLLSTRIPANHDAIKQAYSSRLAEMGVPRDVLGVVSAIEAQATMPFVGKKISTPGGTGN